MSGLEYSAAAMLQHGMVEEGMSMVRAISKRFVGRHHATGNIRNASNSTVTVTGIITQDRYHLMNSTLFPALRSGPTAVSRSPR